MDVYREQAAGLDMKRYWREQKENPKNDTGNPFGDPFCEMVLPRTPSEEEFQAFLRTQPADFWQPVETLQPVQVPGCLAVFDFGCGRRKRYSSER